MPTRPFLPDLDRWLQAELEVEQVLGRPGDWVVSTRKAPLSPDEIRGALRRKKSIWLEEWKQDARLDLRSEEFHSELTLVRCHFPKSVNASGARFHRPVTLIGCVFEDSLTLAGAHFEAGVTFHECYFGIENDRADDAAQMKLDLESEDARQMKFAIEPRSHPGAPAPAPADRRELARFIEAPDRRRSAWWPGLRVEGILRLDRCTFAGSLNLAESRIKGPLLMRGIMVGMHRRADGSRRGRLHLRQLRVEGDVDLSPHVPSRDFTRPRRSFVFGSVVLAAVEIEGRIDCRGAWIEGRLHMMLAHVRDRLAAGAWAHPHDQAHVHVIPAEFGERYHVAVQIADTIIEHGVEMDGAVLRGQMNAKNARIGGDFYLRHPRRDDGEVHSPDATLREFRTCILVDPASIKDAVRMPGADIAGSLELDGAVVRGVLNFQHLKVGGDLLLRDVRQEGRGAEMLRLRTTRIGRSLDLRGADIAGEVNAHGVHVEGDCHFGAWRALDDPARWNLGIYRGTLNLTGIHVGGDLRFCGGLFLAPVLAEGASVGHRCDFTGGIFCRAFDLDDAVVCGELLAGHRKDARRIEEDRALPGSEWTPSGTWFAEELTLRRTEIHGDFRFEGLVLGELPPMPLPLDPRDPRLLVLAACREICERRQADPVDRTRLNLRLATIAGAWTTPRDPEQNNLRPPVGRGFRSPAPAQRDDLRTVFGQPPHFEKHLRVCGSIHAEHAEIKGRLQLAWAKIDADLKLENARVGGDLILHRSVVGGKLDLSSATISGDMFPRVRESGRTRPEKGGDVRIGGVLDLRYAHLQNVRLRLDAASTGRSPERVDLVQAEVARLEVTGRLPVHVAPFIEMSGLRFRQLDLAGFNGGKARHLTWCQRRRRQLYLARKDLKNSVFFLRQMVVMDAGLYARVEAWHRERNEFDEADNVYIERRLQELEHGLLAACVCLFAAALLWFAAKLVDPKRRRRLWKHQLGLLYVASPHGRAAFQHPKRRRHGLLQLHRWCRQRRAQFADLLAALERTRLRTARLRRYFSHRLFRTSRVRLRRVLEPASFAAANLLHRLRVGRRWHRRIHTAGQWARECWRRFWVAPVNLFAFARMALVADGVRPVRLLCVCLLAFLFSWLCIFSQADSVEHPATFVAPMTSKGQFEWLDRMGKPKRKDWGIGSGFWVALNLHIPLVQFIARNDWEPASSPGHFTFLGHRHRLWRGMQYDTYAGIMQVLSWLSVPLVISAATGLLKKR